VEPRTCSVRVRGGRIARPCRAGVLDCRRYLMSTRTEDQTPGTKPLSQNAGLNESCEHECSDPSNRAGGFKRTRGWYLILEKVVKADIIEDFARHEMICEPGRVVLDVLASASEHPRYRAGQDAGGDARWGHLREDGCGSTVQLFGKSGWSSRTLRAYTQKESPRSIVRKMPLAYDNQRAPQKRSHFVPRIIDRIAREEGAGPQ
jgi:hypothetical protein